MGVNVVLSTVWADGGRHARARVVRLCPASGELDAPVEKTRSCAGSSTAGKSTVGFGGCRCIRCASQAIQWDDPALLGAPAGFTVTVRSVTVSRRGGLSRRAQRRAHDARLPKVPAAENTSMTSRITGLF